MNRCCYQFTSCTTCPECGSRIVPKRRFMPVGEELDLKIHKRNRLERKAYQDTGFQENLQDEYYDSFDGIWGQDPDDN